VQCHWKKIVKKARIYELALQGPVAADWGRQRNRHSRQDASLRHYPLFSQTFPLFPLGPLFSSTFPVRSVKITSIPFRFSANQDFLSQPQVAGFAGSGSLPD
jgi:hypothetical protein